MNITFLTICYHLDRSALGQAQKHPRPNFRHLIAPIEHRKYKIWLFTWCSCSRNMFFFIHFVLHFALILRYKNQFSKISHELHRIWTGFSILDTELCSPCGCKWHATQKSRFRIEKLKTSNFNTFSIQILYKLLCKNIQKSKFEISHVPKRMNLKLGTHSDLVLLKQKTSIKNTLRSTFFEKIKAFSRPKPAPRTPAPLPLPSRVSIESERSEDSGTLPYQLSIPTFTNKKPRCARLRDG